MGESDGILQQNVQHKYRRTHTCFDCNETIVGKHYSKVRQKYYHTECWKCFHCGVILKGGSACIKKNKFYCKPCIIQLGSKKKDARIRLDSDTNTLSVDRSANSSQQPSDYSTSSDLHQTTSKRIETDPTPNRNNQNQQNVSRNTCTSCINLKLQLDDNHSKTVKAFQSNSRLLRKQIKIIKHLEAKLEKERNNISLKMREKGFLENELKQEKINLNQIKDSLLKEKEKNEKH